MAVGVAKVVVVVAKVVVVVAKVVVVVAEVVVVGLVFFLLNGEKLSI
jgi:hypothetical protein